MSGTYRWQLTRALPKRDASGAITKWYGSVLDVDDKRRAEEALRDADHRKDEFLAMLAHELRNPLAPISMRSPCRRGRRTLKSGTRCGRPWNARSSTSCAW